MSTKKLIRFIVVIAAVLALLIPLVVITGKTILMVGKSDLKEAVVIECTYRNYSGRSGRSRQNRIGTGYRSYYAPVALTPDGDRAVGTRFLSSKAWCERMIGTSVPMFVHSEDVKKNRIGSFVQFWLFPVVGFIFLTLILLQKFGRVKYAILMLLPAIAVPAIGFEFNFFGVNRPETNLTSDSGKFNACVNKALSKQGIREWAELKKLACNPLPDIKTLEEFVSVENILIISEKFESLNQLPDFPNLKKLSVRNSRLLSLDGLDRYTQLTDLKLTEVEFASIENIPHQLNLRKLLIRSNPSLRDLTGIEKFTDLESVEIERNNVSDITALATLDKLKTVQIFNEPVADLSPLVGLNDLEVARFRSLPTHDFSPVYNKPKMRHSGATGNKIPCEEMKQWMATLDPARRKFMWLPGHCKFLKDDF